MLTYFACCNASGNKKNSLMINGNARKPMYLERKAGKAIGFDYYNNRNMDD